MNLIEMLQFFLCNGKSSVTISGYSGSMVISPMHWLLLFARTKHDPLKFPEGFLLQYLPTLDR
jgi:hypothetical protein